MYFTHLLSQTYKCLEQEINVKKKTENQNILKERFF